MQQDESWMGTKSRGKTQKKVHATKWTTTITTRGGGKAKNASDEQQQRRLCCSDTYNNDHTDSNETHILLLHQERKIEQPVSICVSLDAVVVEKTHILDPAGSPRLWKPLQATMVDAGSDKRDNKPYLWHWRRYICHYERLVKSHPCSLHQQRRIGVQVPWKKNSMVVVKWQRQTNDEPEGCCMHYWERWVSAAHSTRDAWKQGFHRWARWYWYQSSLRWFYFSFERGASWRWSWNFWNTKEK